MKKPYLSGAVISCVPTLGWWYWVRSTATSAELGLEGIYGPFFTRDAARLDRANRLKAIKFKLKYRTPYADPIHAKAFVRVENGKPVWRRVQDTIGYAIAGATFDGLSSFGVKP